MNCQVIKKDFYLQTVNINPTKLISIYYEDGVFDKPYVILITIEKYDGHWTVKDLSGQGKSSKLSKETTNIKEWKYDVEFFLSVKNITIDDVSQIRVEYARIHIYANGKHYEADPFSGIIKGSN